MRKSEIPQCGLLPTLLIGYVGQIYIVCKYDRIKAINSSSLGNKWKVLRNFSVELNEFNLLMNKSERIFISTRF